MVLVKKPWFLDLSRLVANSTVRIGTLIDVKPGSEQGQIDILFKPIEYDSSRPRLIKRVERIEDVPEMAFKQVPSQFAPKSCGGMYILTCDKHGSPFMKWLGIESAETIGEMRRQIVEERSRTASARTRARSSEIGDARIFKDHAAKDKVLKERRLRRLPGYRERDDEEEEYG